MPLFPDDVVNIVVDDVAPPVDVFVVDEATAEVVADDDVAPPWVVTVEEAAPTTEVMVVLEYDCDVIAPFADDVIPAACVVADVEAWDAAIAVWAAVVMTTSKVTTTNLTQVI